MSEIVANFLKLKGFPKLNDIQKQAVACGVLDGKGNFLVFAPTGSGKTGIAELAMLQELVNNGKVIYTVPSHALISDKLNEFKYLTQYQIEEGGSSFANWKKSDIVVTTFELLYRACLLSKEFLKDFSIVIVDEFHILYDEARGYNLEKLLTILKESKVRIFCISATFEDKKEASEWLNAKIVEIPEQLRVVQIQYSPLDLTRKGSNLASAIMAAKNTPTLVFCATKPHTKERAEEICKLLQRKNDRETLIQEVKEVIDRDDLPEAETSLVNCLEYGVGFHHSDLNTDLREYVSKLFIDRKIDYLFCTTGLAYGVNFPAKTVVVADLALFDFEDKTSKPIPTHLFLQMAGRAGRIKFGTEGYCYVVLRKSGDFDQFKDYLSGKLTNASSKISRDDHFYKAILELVYSKRDTETEIMNFFKQSFFNFQASRIKNLMVPFNLQGLLTDRMNALCRAGFIEQMGVQYRLTPFGNVTLEYLFSGVSSPELLSFLRLNSYVKGQAALEFNFNYVHFISKHFSDCRISKQPRSKVAEIETFLQTKGIADRAHPEYSAYVVFNKWIENVNERDIDSTCSVLSSNLSAKMREMAKLIELSQKLAEANNIPVAASFDVSRQRIYYGVREEELPLVKIRGIKRELVRAVKSYCDGVLKTLHNYNGTCIEILKALLVKEGEAEFLRRIETIQRIGPLRSKKLLELVKAIEN